MVYICAIKSTNPPCQIEPCIVFGIYRRLSKFDILRLFTLLIECYLLYNRIVLNSITDHVIIKSVYLLYMCFTMQLIAKVFINQVQ